MVSFEKKNKSLNKNIRHIHVQSLNKIKNPSILIYSLAVACKYI